MKLKTGRRGRGCGHPWLPGSGLPSLAFRDLSGPTAHCRCLWLSPGQISHLVFAVCLFVDILLTYIYWVFIYTRTPSKWIHLMTLWENKHCTHLIGDVFIWENWRSETLKRDLCSWDICNLAVEDKHTKWIYMYICALMGCFQVALAVKNLPAKAGDIRDKGSIPASGRSPGGGNGHPFQYSCLENPMDRGAWRATIHRAGHIWSYFEHACMCFYTWYIWREVVRHT